MFVHCILHTTSRLFGFGKLIALKLIQTSKTFTYSTRGVHSQRGSCIWQKGNYVLIQDHSQRLNPKYPNLAFPKLTGILFIMVIFNINLLNPFTLRVPLESIVCIYENNLERKRSKSSQKSEGELLYDF